MQTAFGRCLSGAVFLLLLNVVAVTAARGETIFLPLTLDYPLLRSLIVQQAYPGPGESVRVVDSEGGCNWVILSHPQVSEDRGYLRFQTRVRLQWGMAVGEGCFSPINWQGQVVLWQRPQVNDRWQLFFAAVDSDLLDPDGLPATLAGLVWEQVKGYVHDYLERITIDLAPPVDEVKAFLLPLFDQDHQETARRFLDSMHPDQPTSDADEIKMNILAEVVDAEQSDQQLSDPEVSSVSPTKVMDLWPVWDGLLMHMISRFVDEPLDEQDRQVLLDTLLAVRYEFEDVLKQKRLTTGFVRSQFVQSWQRLEPLFRRHLTDDPSQNLLGFLAFFTAGDALVALDRVGPAMGIEITREGLYRLAELISDQPVGSLEEIMESNPQLRKVLGLDPLEEREPPRQPSSSIYRKGKSCWTERASNWMVWKLLGPAAAWAGEFKAPDLKEIRRWAAETTSTDALLNRVRKVLIQAVLQQKNKVQPLVGADWFRRMVLATAWQESCFRQFHVKKNTITYLLSYNQTSVGLMQVNERIWRGLYNRQKLRWDIHYNAGAGAEILAMYLNRYISREQPSPDLSSTKGSRFHAVWLYALYNGGPSQLKKLPRRYKGKQLFESEKLFLAKLEKVHSNGWIKQVECL